MMQTWISLLVGILVFAGGCGKGSAERIKETTPQGNVKDGFVTFRPNEIPYAIRNPLKGWRDYFGPGVDSKRMGYPEPYGAMIKEYMQWNMLEGKVADGVEKIIQYSDHRWRGVENANVKVIPRIFIVWMEPWHGGRPKSINNADDLNGWHWPSDIPPQSHRPDDLTMPITGGYFDPSFQDRVRALIAKAAKAWDNDPRVAYVEMGIIGEWGEHHNPNVSTYWPPQDQPNHVANRTWIPGIEKTLGDAFREGFKNKKVMVRYAYDFKDYDFGIYWDSWGMPEQNVKGFEEMKKLGDRWKTQPIGGEITWNWGTYKTKYSTGRAADGLPNMLKDQSERSRLVDIIRELHCNHLGGVTWADFNDHVFLSHAEELQKAMGYRFIVPEFKYPVNIEKGMPLNISFRVQNIGSSPFYYNWPVEISLLDKRTKEKVWGTVLDDVNISDWMPGENWDAKNRIYEKAAPIYTIECKTTYSGDLPEGEYIVALSVLDPAGMLPSLRLAITNYFEGGRHPMGLVGVKHSLSNFIIEPETYTDLRQDRTLRYVLE